MLVPGVIVRILFKIVIENIYCLKPLKIFLSRVSGLYIGLHVKYLKKMPSATGHIHTSSVNIITI